MIFWASSFFALGLKRTPSHRPSPPGAYRGQGVSEEIYPAGAGCHKATGQQSQVGLDLRVRRQVHSTCRRSMETLLPWGLWSIIWLRGKLHYLVFKVFKIFCMIFKLWSFMTICMDQEDFKLLIKVSQLFTVVLIVFLPIKLDQRSGNRKWADRTCGFLRVSFPSAFTCCGAGAGMEVWGSGCVLAVAPGREKVPAGRMYMQVCVTLANGWRADLLQRTLKWGVVQGAFIFCKQVCLSCGKTAQEFVLLVWWNHAPPT